MRLTRSNDDPKLLDDLERLARSYGPADREPQPLASEAVDAEIPAAADGADGEEAAEPSVFDDPFVRRFVRVSVHVKRYAPFYAGAAVWMLAMLLIQPLGGNDRGDVDGQYAAATSTRTVARTPAPSGVAAAVPAAAVESVPVYDDFGGSSLSPGSTSSFDSSSSGSTFAGSSSAGAGDTASTAPAFDDSFATFDDEDTLPDPLTIVASGYASSTGGTPLEQDPGKGGLPVAATGGNDTKRSFIRLSGDETTLLLQENTDGAIRSDAGGIKACVITASWQPARGQALAAGPAFDASNCSTGVRSAEGLWTFDLSGFGPLAESEGFALTPAAGTASTFQVVFSPTPLPSSTSS